MSNTLNGVLNGFFGGVIIGALTLAGLLILFKATPVYVMKNIHNEAVSLGHGRWVVDKNNYAGSSPTTYFEWITNASPTYIAK